jgi:hypothetical protein
MDADKKRTKTEKEPSNALERQMATPQFERGGEAAAKNLRLSASICGYTFQNLWKTNAKLWTNATR